MSLSPIFSMIKELLVVLTESEFTDPKLIDMWRDVAATRLPTEEFLLLCKDETFAFFVEDRDEGVIMEVGAGFCTLRFDICGGLGVGDTGFFLLVPTKFGSFLVGVI